MFSLNKNKIHKDLKNISLEKLKITLYGFGKSHLLFFLKKFEKHQKHVYADFKTNYRFFNKHILLNLPIPISIYSKHLLNIYTLDIIQSYKSTRHSRGLPCRGQRTWTNAWSAYRTNTTLRTFKIKLLNKVYGKTPTGQVNMYYLAEQINMLWKVFWKDEWINARKKVLVSSKKKNFSIDVASMASGNVVSPVRLKKMSKKQKSSLGKNTLTLGFEIGFTRKVLLDLQRLERFKKLRTNTMTKKKKKIDIKTKKIKHKLKQKSKKSLWD